MDSGDKHLHWLQKWYDNLILCHGNYLLLTILLHYFLFSIMLTNSMNSLNELLSSSLSLITKPPNKHVPKAVLGPINMPTVILLNCLQLINRYTKMITDLFPFCDQPSKSSKKGEVTINWRCPNKSLKKKIIISKPLNIRFRRCSSSISH